MLKIPYLSLEITHNELRGELESAFNKVLSDNNFILGDEVSLFEKNYAEYTSSKFAVGCGNGLDAIYLVLKAMGIGAGDNVIVPSNTYIATALAVSYTGATPVFVEPELETFNINPALIEEKIDKNTKAIIAVNLYGRMCEMDTIAAIANKYGIKLIEDSAQAHGATYKNHKSGFYSYAACYSFYPGKNLGALGDAGIITTNDASLAEKLKMIRNYGSKIKYINEIIGVNSRLDELQAAFLNAKLPHLDKWNKERNRIANRIISEVNNPLIVLPKANDSKYGNVWHVFAVLCKCRDELELYLNNKGIGVNKHYPTPIHLQKAYFELNIPKGDLPIAEMISELELSLPVYYGMTEQQIDYLVDSLNAFDCEVC